MERWTALLPDKLHLHGSTAAVPSIHNLKPVLLIGKLPVDAYTVILQYLPIPDIASVALCNRRLAALSKEDAVWSFKVRYLNYAGPGAVMRRVRRADGDEGKSETSTTMRGDVEDLVTVQGRDVHSALKENGLAIVDEDFGDFFSSDVAGMVPRLESFDVGGEELLFNDFEENPSKSFDLDDDFDSVELAVDKDARVDSMMSFEEPVEIQITSAKRELSIRPIKTSSPVTPILLTPSVAFESYRQIYIAHHNLLLPYYISLITHTTSSLLFTSPTLTPNDRSQLLSALTRFCSPLLAPTRSLPQRMTVLRNVQSACDFFESAMLAEFERADSRRDEAAMRDKARVLWELNGGSSVIQVFVQRREIFYEQSHNALNNLTRVETPSGESVDGIDFTAMDGFMKHVLEIVMREGGLIARVFPPDADVLIYFTERIANDVISDYITSLLSAAQPLQPPLFLLATAATFGQVYRLLDAVLEIEPKSALVTKERAEDVIFRMFEPLMDDYLSEEADWIRNVLEEICAEWDAKTASDLAIMDPTFLTSQNPAQVKRNVLVGFAKVLLLPVTIIPKTAAYGFNVISIGATGAFNTVASLGAGLGVGFGASGSNSKAKVVSSDPTESAGWSIDDATVDTTEHILSTQPDHASPNEASSIPVTTNRFDRMQMLLSLNTALQLIQSNRDCLKRIQTFVRYPGAYGKKVRDGIEEVFIILLQTLSDKHICPGFAKATAQMARYQAKDHVGGTSVAPLVQFFELVHIGDTIQQMIQVYFDKEMANYIDKRDFNSSVLREKKRFETALDDSVAQGLNASVNILMNQVEHIISTQQGERDFNPVDGADLELHASLACREVIECLTTHCDMLRGSTDKQILEVFHQEVGIRLHSIILKHLKHVVVSIDGGFQLISDLNAYHTFASTLRQSSITISFACLKLAGEIFIIDSPKDLSVLIRDVARYEATLSGEDLYELCQQRADWKIISVEVDKQLFGLKIGEDCCVS